MNTPNPYMKLLPVRRISIQCTDHPDWGTAGIMEDHGGYYDIHLQSGGRVLDKDEATTFWEVMPDAARRPSPHTKSPMVVNKFPVNQDVEAWAVHAIQPANDSCRVNPCVATFTEVGGSLAGAREANANAILFSHAPHLYTELRALLDWARAHTSPTQANSPHDLLVRASTLLAIIDASA